MQKNLLDTHALIWFINGDQQLSLTAKNAIENEEAINLVSIVSIWEMAIKISLGKLELKSPFIEINNQITANNFLMLPIEIEDTLILSSLPFYHRDPFDRLLISQAIRNDLLLLSKDEHFNSYEVKTSW